MPTENLHKEAACRLRNALLIDKLNVRCECQLAVVFDFKVGLHRPMWLHYKPVGAFGLQSTSSQSRGFAVVETTNRLRGLLPYYVHGVNVNV